MNTLPPFRETGAPAPPAAPKPQPGNGTRLTSGALGFSYSVPAQKGAFPHPFRPALGLTFMTFAKGLVETREPTIDGVPISGPVGGGAPPQLRLDFATANAAGESWACIELVPNDLGRLDGTSRLEMVHTAQPLSDEPKVARCPVALILWRNRLPSAVHHILYFNVRYQRVTLNPNEGPPRHLFF